MIYCSILRKKNSLISDLKVCIYRIVRKGFQKVKKNKKYYFIFLMLKIITSIKI